MRCALLLFVGGVLAAATAQVQFAPAITAVLPGSVALSRSYDSRRGYHDYYDYHHDHHDSHRRRPLPLPYDEHRFPENHPSYAYAPNMPTNYLPNYYNFPARNPTHYDYGSYWYPEGPGPHPNTNPQGWYGHRYGHRYGYPPRYHH